MQDITEDLQHITEAQQQAVKLLLQNLNSDNLWNCILAFEHYSFTTTSGLPFTYSFKKNRHGQPGNEIIVSRKEKTITRSSVEMALGVVMAAGEIPVKMSTPKDLGVFCASYIYPLFIRLGLIEHVGSSRRGGRMKAME